jgi:hypothetical protein
VGVGGGLVRPMQSRWEQWLTSAEREKDTIRAHVRRRESLGDQAARIGQDYPDRTTTGSHRAGATSGSESDPVGADQPATSELDLETRRTH